MSAPHPSPSGSSGDGAVDHGPVPVPAAPEPGGAGEAPGAPVAGVIPFDPALRAAGPADTEEPVLAMPQPHVLVQRLRRSGWTAVEAGNLAAFVTGLRPVESGWTATEIVRLRFVAALAAEGRLHP